MKGWDHIRRERVVVEGGTRVREEERFLIVFRFGGAGVGSI